MEFNEESLIQGSESWKQLRRNSVTATDISKIIGCNQYCTALKLWNQKLGLEPEQQENEAMRIGSQLEPIALKKFKNEIFKDMADEVDYKPAVVFHQFDKWKMASLDGLGSTGTCAVEIKCSKNIYEKAKNGIIDDMYKCQVQWQMYITDLKSMYFAAYWNEEIVIIEVKRDDDFLNEIMPKVEEFYRSMLEFSPPQATDKDYVVKDDGAWFFMANEWKRTKAMLKELEAREEEERQALIDMCGGLSSYGAGVKISKCVKKGNVIYKNIPELASIDLEKYRSKPSTYYRISENG